MGTFCRGTEEEIDAEELIAFVALFEKSLIEIRARNLGASANEHPFAVEIGLSSTYQSRLRYAM
jgi:hypothetical protein